MKLDYACIIILDTIECTICIILLLLNFIEENTLIIDLFRQFYNFVIKVIIIYYEKKILKSNIQQKFIRTRTHSMNSTCYKEPIKRHEKSSTRLVYHLNH